MLKLLRHKGTQKKIYIGLAITVVLSFVVSGVLVSRDDKKATSSLATLGKRKITAQEYLNSYRAVQHQAEWMYGDKLNEMRSRINFKGEAWDRLLLLDYAKKENIRASDAEVVRWITTQTIFESKGRFDQKYYEMYIERALRMDARSFEEEVRQMLTLQKLQEKIRTDQPLTEAKLKEIYLQEKSEKNLLYALLPGSKFKDQITVTDKDTEQLYGLIKNQLTAPEQVKVSYITIPQDKLEASKAALDDNAPIEELVKKYGLTLKGTDYFSKNDNVADLGALPEVLSQAFALAPGKESAWIRHESGATKIKVEDKKGEHLMSAEEAKGMLKKIFAQQKGSELALKKLKDLKEKMKGGEFESVLKAENLEIAPMERYKRGAYPSESLDKAVSTLKEGEISDPFEVPDGAMIVKVTKVMAADDKKFSEEKEAFRKDVESRNSGEAMNILLEKLRKGLSLNLELMKEIFPSD